MIGLILTLVLAQDDAVPENVANDSGVVAIVGFIVMAVIVVAITARRANQRRR